MQITDRHIRLLALKLVEVFSRVTDSRFPFERYWPLVGPLEAFSAQVTNPLEAEVAKALRTALEAALKDAAPRSIHPDAAAVAATLGVPARRYPPWKPMAAMKARKKKR